MNSRERFYRDYTGSSRWKTFRVKVDTTDLLIRARKDLSEKAERSVRRFRKEILDHIEKQESFLTSLDPVEKYDGAPPIIRRMYEASEKADVGPMAAVAGAIAEFTGKDLLGDSDEVIVENGGDIWMKLAEPTVVNLFPGGIYFAGKIFLKIDPDRTPCGICTSSAKMGHSLSFGRADAATVISGDAALADAVATGLGNRVKSEDDMVAALAYAMSVEKARGAIVVLRDRMALLGDIELAQPGEGEK